MHQKPIKTETKKQKKELKQNKYKNIRLKYSKLYMLFKVLTFFNTTNSETRCIFAATNKQKSINKKNKIK